MTQSPTPNRQACRNFARNQSHSTNLLPTGLAQHRTILTGPASIPDIVHLGSLGCSLGSLGSRRRVTPPKQVFKTLPEPTSPGSLPLLDQPTSYFFNPLDSIDEHSTSSLTTSTNHSHLPTTKQHRQNGLHWKVRHPITPSLTHSPLLTLPPSDICKIIFAVILPPLGVFLELGCDSRLLLNILLTVLGVSLFSGIPSPQQ